MRKPPNRDPQRQQEWRDVTPELARIVDEVAPRLWDEARTTPADSADAEWRSLIDALAARVRERALKRRDDISVEERRGYEWSSAVNTVAGAFEYMMYLIRRDLSFQEDSETLASMVLVRRSMEQLQLELQGGGTRHGRDDAEEHTVRVFRALRALTQRFDDVSMRRFRALNLLEASAATVRILRDDEVEAAVDRMRAHAAAAGTPFDAEEEHRQRKWFRAELPMMRALNARGMLADIDSAFANLDPLIVLEDLAEAATGAKGGKSDGGEAKTGPARSLARLALRCGALDYVQSEDELFDDAVERVRKNLHTTRSRLRDELRGFPGQHPV